MNRHLLSLIFVMVALIALSEARGGRRRRPHFSRVHGWGGRRSGVPKQKQNSGKCPMRLVCQVEGPADSDVKFQVHTCPEESECSVGPLLVNGTGVLDGQSFGVTFCNALDSNGNLKVLSSACSIFLSNGTVARNETASTDKRPRFWRRFMRTKPQQPCSIGPLKGNVTFDGEEAEAFFRMPPHLDRLMVKGEGKKDIKSMLKSFHEKIFGSKSWKKFFG